MSLEPISRVLVMVAMNHEGISMVKQLNLQLLDKSKYDLVQPMIGYHGNLGNGEVLLVVNGVRDIYNLDGTKRTLNDIPVQVEGVSPVPSAIATWEAIRVFKPHIVISAGTAGGVRGKGVEKGKVYLSDSPVRYHDRLINFRLPGDSFEPNNYQVFGIGNFPSVHCQNLSKALNLPFGHMSTGSSFDQAQGNIAVQFEKNGAYLKEMEVAAVAEASLLRGVPFFAIKGVTDYIDPGEDFNEQFEKELEPVSEVVARTLFQVVSFVIGKNISQL